MILLTTENGINYFLLTTVEPRCIVPVTFVFPHILSALFGPGTSPIQITLFFPASIGLRTVVVSRRSLKNHGPDATFSHMDSFFTIWNDLVRCARVYCYLSAAWIACCVLNQIPEWENCLNFHHFGFSRDWDACIFLYKTFERLGKSWELLQIKQ
jgi:hypothetical protein